MFDQMIFFKLTDSRFQEDLVKLRSEKEGVGDNTLWTILKEMMESKRKMIEKYSPWDLDVNSPGDDKTKTCDIFQITIPYLSHKTHSLL